ncbi:MAG: pentapeptide repeat-containing protein [Henriciella sp.]|nr:pentapeptide repeat-containing protein [Henriciella sp.]
MTISDEWWDRWWEQDWSWEGLAQKLWRGWYVDTAWAEGEAFEPVPEDERVEGVDYREATLQDYWRRAMLEAGLSENDYLVWVANEAWAPRSLRDRHDTRIHFTLMHLPPKWQDGTATIKAYPENPPQALVALLKIELGREVRETKLRGPDHRIRWDGGVLPDFRLSNLSPQARSEDGKSPISLSARNAAFSGGAYFQSAAFSGYADFESAAFSGDADFESAIFVGVAIFSGQGNSVKSDAVSARLMPDPVQQGVQKFEQPEAIMWTARRSFPFANFREAIFLEPARFDNRDFHSKADFDETSFFKHAAFHGSDLHRGVVFRDTHFSASLNPEKGFAGSQSLWAKLRKRKNVQLLPESALRRLHEVFVRRCEVADEVAPAFNDWAQAFEAMRRWKAAIFAGVAKDGAKAKLDRLKYFGASEDSFRTLKQIMEDRRDRMEEARFFKLELLARRQRRGGWWAKLPSRIYGGLSDFGSSMVRPFLWLVVSVLLFAFLYAAMGAFFAGGFGSHDYCEALNYSLSRVFPFGDWTEVRDCSLIGQMQADGGNYELCLGEGETAYKYRVGTALTVRFVGMVQSLFALILVFLLGLAARRRFQIN